MRKLVAVEFLSVDGVMQGLGSPDEDRDGGFELGGWGLPYGDVLHEVLDPAGLEATTAYLFGRRTYDKMAMYWPFQSAENPMAASLNAVPKHVASRSVRVFGWSGTEPLPDDLPVSVSRLKSVGDGDIVILGSGDVVRQLVGAGLLDELRLFIHPLLLGAGKRLFGDLPAPLGLRTDRVAATSKGTVAITYSLDGAVGAPGQS